MLFDNIKNLFLVIILKGFKEINNALAAELNDFQTFFHKIQAIDELFLGWGCHPCPL